MGPGQPDQACDLVVASVLEEYLRRDPESRVNIRACGGQGSLFLAGEISSSVDFDVSAIVKQVLANAGVMGVIEPFIAFEPMHAAWAVGHGARELTVAQGYATTETPELFPRELVLASKIGMALEQKRTQDPDWFWLGADYEVSVITQTTKPLILIRAEHLETQSVEQVRILIQTLCLPSVEGAEVRVNEAGKETQAGLKNRIGSSGQLTVDRYVSAPASASGIGVQLRHPRVLGAIACRAIARRLVREGRGTAIAVRATWLPLETSASFIRVWNEAGADLSTLIQPEELDLTRLPASWTSPSIATSLVKRWTDATVRLPWEI